MKEGEDVTDERQVGCISSRKRQKKIWKDGRVKTRKSNLKDEGNGYGGKIQSRLKA